MLRADAARQLGEDPRDVTAAEVLAHFERHGIAAERTLTDNGGCYRSRSFTSTAAARGLWLKRTRPFRPQTNGKAEAFIKILQAEWGYRRPYSSNRERLDALPVFLVYYNQHRPHGGLAGQGRLAPGSASCGVSSVFLSAPRQQSRRSWLRRCSGTLTRG